MKKKKSMMDLLEQVENDPRFSAAIQSLHDNFQSTPPLALSDTSKDQNIEENPNINQTNTKTVSLINKPKNASERSDSKIIIPLDEHTVPRSAHLTVIPSDHQSIIPTDGVIDTQSVQQTSRPSVKLTNRPIDHQTIYHTNTPSDYISIPSDVLTLSKHQSHILDFLINKPSNGYTCYKEITRCTDITLISVRGAISRLVQKGFIQKPVTIRNAVFQGFSYILNKTLCDHFINIGGFAYYQSHHQTILPSDQQTTYQTNESSDSHTVTPSNGMTPHSSSSYLNIKTTTANGPSDPNTKSLGDGNFVLNGPEMGFWLEAGLQERQAQKWCSEFDVTPTDLKRQLAWARWDLVENGKEKEVNKNAISWVYGHFRKTACCYSRPDNYQTPVELRAVKMRIDQEKEEKARQEIERLEEERVFTEILSNKDGEEYKALLAGLSEFEKGLEKGGKAFENLLRSKFIDLRRKNSNVSTTQS